MNLPDKIKEAAEAACKQYSNSIGGRSYNAGELWPISQVEHAFKEAWSDCHAHLLTLAPEFDRDSIYKAINAKESERIKNSSMDKETKNIMLGLWCAGAIDGAQEQHKQMAAQIAALKEDALFWKRTRQIDLDAANKEIERLKAELLKLQKLVVETQKQKPKEN